MELGCIVMAAGSASRFGSNKLLASLEGRPLIAYGLDALPAQRFAAVVVVTQYERVADLARERGFQVLYYRHPERGQSESIKLGLGALSTCDGVLFQVADQPYLRQDTLLRLIDLFAAHPRDIAALGHHGQRGNPCLFAARFFPELMALTGDRGGSGVIRRYPQALHLLEVEARELLDIDTPEILARLQ